MPTPVKLEVTTLLANVVPVNVFEFAATVISELPSKATPFIFFVAANFVAVEALPVNAPTKFVAVTVLNPAKLEAVAPNATLVVPIVKALFAKLAFAIAVPLQTPEVIVPTVAKLASEVNVVLEVAVIFPAVVAVVALPKKLVAVTSLLNVFAPAKVCAPVEIKPGFVASAAANVKLVPLMVPPLA